MACVSQRCGGSWREPCNEFGKQTALSYNSIQCGRIAEYILWPNSASSIVMLCWCCYMCGGHRGLAHPRSRDGLLPTRHLLINTETYSRVKWLVENFSQCVWRAVRAASKRPAIYSAHTEKWCLCVCVLCVGNYVPTTTTAETTYGSETWKEMKTATSKPQTFWCVVDRAS